jgi:hypothetical protein
MTVAQLYFELNIDDADKTESLTEKWKRSRMAGFDRLCERFKLTPVALSVKPADEVARMLRELFGPASLIDTDSLPERIREYCEAKAA